MATVDPDEIVPFPEVPTEASPTSSSDQIALDQPPKLKGRHKILQSLQRISSSPTLARRNRSASTGYRRDGKASLSCVSLSQSSYSPCPSNGSASQLYGGLNGRPTTPGPTGSHTPEDDQEGNSRIRFVFDSPNGPQSRKVALPTELRPGSRGSPLASSELRSAPKTFDFWGKIPIELGMLIFSYLTPKEIVRCSSVCKWWNKMCYDGQLWSNIDTTDYYRDIPSDALMKIIMSGGPFIRDLNLRGCIQLRDKWLNESEKITASCRNVVNFSLEGSRIDKTPMHYFLLRNERLEYINVSGLDSVTNSAMRIIAKSCPQLRILNVSWCAGVNTTGLKRIIKACPKLTDLLASEIRGFDDKELPLELFKRNTLERLVISRTDITDETLTILMHGVNPEMDVLEDRAIVPPRRLRHLDLHQCSELTDKGAQSLIHNVPDLVGLQLSGCTELTDDSVVPIIQTAPQLTHLELEELENLTNRTLTELANSSCAPFLEYLNVSYCEALSDPGMLAVMKNCPSLQFIEMDNTRISDLTLAEASFRVRKRGYDEKLPQIGLRMVIFDCPNVTWVGVKELMSGNTRLPRPRKVPEAVSMVTQTINMDGTSESTPMITSSITPPPPPALYPNHIIQVKCFYGWQMTVDEHTKRVLRGDLAAANRLERKWSDYMVATEEAGAAGAGARRRRRRAREAERIYNDDDDDEEAYGFGGMLGGRRRARSGGSCTVM
ncbi:F-box domain protein [Aspergillus lucknowensis]|uniref:F-box domain-containing protein n=1 Tax=Aspergillus lucknowensis TaxID=176173 RepID=A0ABR4LVV7_9EURO